MSQNFLVLFSGHLKPDFSFLLFYRIFSLISKMEHISLLRTKLPVKYLLSWLVVKFGVLALFGASTFFRWVIAFWEIWKWEKKGRNSVTSDEMPMLWRSWKFTLSRWARVDLWGSWGLLLERKAEFFSKNFKFCVKKGLKSQEKNDQSCLNS